MNTMKMRGILPEIDDLKNRKIVNLVMKAGIIAQFFSDAVNPHAK